MMMSQSMIGAEATVVSSIWIRLGFQVSNLKLSQKVHLLIQMKNDTFLDLSKGKMSMNLKTSS